MVSLAVSLSAIVISALAYVEMFRGRRLQQEQYDASRSARVSLSGLAFWPAKMYPTTPEDRSDTIRLKVRNIGPVQAFDVDIAVARAGKIRFHGEVYGLPPMVETEAEVRIGTVAENTDETFVMTVRYRDYRPHLAIITLHKRVYPHGLGSGLGLEVVAATLDGSPHPDIVLTADEIAFRRSTAA
jgi:hypothetical protein